jgi:uncharacterized membrane-anchored protein
MIDVMFLFMGLGRFEIMILVVLLLGITLWALVDTIKSDFKNDINKVVWIIVILSIPAFGGILYYLLGKEQKKAG